MEKTQRVEREKQWNAHVRQEVQAGKKRRVLRAVMCVLLAAAMGFAGQWVYIHRDWLVQYMTAERQSLDASVQESTRRDVQQAAVLTQGHDVPSPQPELPVETPELPVETLEPPVEVPKEGSPSPKPVQTTPNRPLAVSADMPKETAPEITPEPIAEPKPAVEPVLPTETAPAVSAEPPTAAVLEVPVEVSTEVQISEAPAAPYYTALYPEMYALPADRESLAPEYTVYLTFDDGPSARTAEVLDILQANGIKATFFVTGQTSELAQAMMQRIVAEGHTIGIHTYTHNYREVYASVEAYLADFNRIYNWVYQVTGVYPQIFRFPGGTVNGFNKGLYKDLVAEMDRRGFVHYDWNAMCGDADGKVHTPQELAQNSLAMLGGKHVIILMHDSAVRATTVACLPSVIAGYRNAGYNFAPLTPEIRAITFD